MNTKLIDLFSTVEHNVVYTALAACAKEYGNENGMTIMGTGEALVYDYLTNIPKTTLVTELTDMIHQLGFKIVKA
jgi:hypothetical protein